MIETASTTISHPLRTWLFLLVLCILPSTTQAHNAAGELMSMTDGRGQVLTYTRDILGRMLTGITVNYGITVELR